MKNEQLILVDFRDHAEAEEAFEALKKKPISENYVVSQACIAENRNGSIETGEIFDTGIETQNDQAVGGLLGMLLGTIVSPLGMLLGWGMGALLGHVLDRSDAAKNLSVIESVAHHLPEGMTVLLALIQEDQEDPEESEFEKLFENYSVIIDRYDAAELVTVCEKANRFQKTLEKEARAHLASEFPDDFREEIEEKRDALKKNFDELKDKWNRRD